MPEIPKPQDELRPCPHGIRHPWACHECDEIAWNTRAQRSAAVTYNRIDAQNDGTGFYVEKPIRMSDPLLIELDAAARKMRELASIDWIDSRRLPMGSTAYLAGLLERAAEKIKWCERLQDDGK
jgi:hypothetical protein